MGSSSTSVWKGFHSNTPSTCCDPNMFRQAKTQTTADCTVARLILTFLLLCLLQTLLVTFFYISSQIIDVENEWQCPKVNILHSHVKLIPWTNALSFTVSFGDLAQNF